MHVGHNFYILVLVLNDCCNLTFFDDCASTNLGDKGKASNIFYNINHSIELYIINRNTPGSVWCHPTLLFTDTFWVAKSEKGYLFFADRCNERTFYELEAFRWHLDHLPLYWLTFNKCLCIHSFDWTLWNVDAAHTSVWSKEYVELSAQAETRVVCSTNFSFRARNPLILPNVIHVNTFSSLVCTAYRIATSHKYI